MSIKTKLKTFFFLDEDEYETPDNNVSEETVKPPKSFPAKQNVVSLQSVQQSAKLVLCEPRQYSEAQEIADHLKNRRSIVVNLQRIDPGQARQIVDFLSGTVYALGGEIQKVGIDIFVCTPDNVEVSGNISELLQEHELQDKRW